MILYYRERPRAFLAIETTTNDYYRQVLGKDWYEGRATCIEGLIGSICTTAISRDYLKAHCNRVAKAKVPKQWLKAIGL